MFYSIIFLWHSSGVYFILLNLNKSQDIILFYYLFYQWHSSGVYFYFY